MTDFTFDIAVMANKTDDKGRITLQMSYNYELSYQSWNVVGKNYVGGYSFCHFFESEKAAVDSYSMEYDKIWK